MTVLVIDYSMGNLGSVKRAFEECGADVFVSENPQDLKTAERFVLPGVGSFRDGMSHLKQAGWVDEIKKAVSEGIPMLGICLGMQLLAEKGYEGGETEGLGLIPGETVRLTPDQKETKIPHVGWNEVHTTQDCPLLNGVPNGTDFYFVHSFQLVPQNQDHAAASTPYCGSFVSVVAEGRTFGVQFHPEKSGKPGFTVIKNFLTA